MIFAIIMAALFLPSLLALFCDMSATANARVRAEVQLEDAIRKHAEARAKKDALVARAIVECPELFETHPELFRD